MNRRSTLWLMIAWGMGLLVGSPAWSALSKDLVTGNAGSEAAQKSIQAFIETEIKQLADESNPQAQQSARQALIQQVGSPDASASFLDTYSQLLNDALVPLSKNKHMRVRLNAAIVVTHVAERVQNTRLSPAALAFIHDPSEAVIFWGLQAADSIIPSILHNPLLARNSPLIEAILPAAKAHPDGPVVQAAYDALSLGIVENRNWAQAVTPQMLQVTTPMLLELLEFRVKRYVHALPVDPQSENRATLFLADKRVWLAETDEQRQQSTKLIMDLLSMLCQYSAHTNQSHRLQLVPVVQQTASALWVIGDFQGSETLKTALQPLVKLGLNSNPETIMAASKASYEAVKTLPGMADMPPPPTTRDAFKSK